MNLPPHPIALATGREIARTSEAPSEECADIDLPGVPGLVAEARAILAQLRGSP